MIERKIKQLYLVTQDEKHEFILEAEDEHGVRFTLVTNCAHTPYDHEDHCQPFFQETNKVAFGTEHA